MSKSISRRFILLPTEPQTSRLQYTEGKNGSLHLSQPQFQVVRKSHKTRPGAIKSFIKAVIDEHERSKLCKVCQSPKCYC